MKHIIVGTAGHVDHGKTALIKALTGFEGDTTKEEIKRGITIDLSFSNMQNSETNVAFIDVPGHEKLIKNMIAGAFGFDAALVVIDANEGIMPQTREHLEILNLLGVQNIIVALSKSDLADEKRLQDSESDIREYISTLSNLILINIIHTSIYSSASIESLRDALFDLPEVKKREDGLFRYYVDRSFSIAGAGAVVTGTVLDGKVQVGDKLVVAELAKEIQIRNIQVHEKDVDLAQASQRAALNLQGSKISLKRGHLLTRKGFMRGFKNIDVFIEAISGREIRHNSTMQFFVGTKQVEAKVLLYNTQESISSGFAKVVFKENMFMVFDEPFVLSLSGHVVAGGRVLSPIDDPIKKRFKLPLLEALERKDFKKAFEILVSTHKRGFGLISSNQRFGLNHNEAIDIANELDGAFVDEEAMVLYPNEIKDELRDLIVQIYRKNQYALLSANSISQRSKWASEKLSEEILQELVDERVLKYDNGIYKSAEIILDDIDTMILNNIYDILVTSGISPEAPYNIYDEMDIDRKRGDKALKKLTKSRKVVRLAHNLFVTYENLQALIADLRQIIRDEGYVDISNLKAHYPELSRKYLIAYLEYLDKQADIKKDGNKRVFA